MARFRNFLRREEGQGLVEYSLIIVLVSVATWLLLQAMGVQIGAVFTQITTILAGV